MASTLPMTKGSAVAEPILFQGVNPDIKAKALLRRSARRHHVVSWNAESCQRRPFQFSCLRQTGRLLESSDGVLGGGAPLTVDGAGVLSPLIQSLLHGTDQRGIVGRRRRMICRRPGRHRPIFPCCFVSHIRASNTAHDGADGSGYYGSSHRAAHAARCGSFGAIHSVPTCTTCKRGNRRDCHDGLTCMHRFHVSSIARVAFIGRFRSDGIRRAMTRVRVQPQLLSGTVCPGSGRNSRTCT